MKRAIVLFLCLLTLPTVVEAVSSIYPDPKILEEMKYIQFELNGQTCEEGRLKWDSDDKTLTVCTENSDVSLQIGQEMYVRGTNKTGATLTNGQVVYINGAQGNRPTFALANSTTEATSARVVGLVTADIPKNGTGYVTTFGLVRGLNTSSFSEGDTLWLSSTPGAMVNSVPTTPLHSTFIGTCVAKDATAGVINVRPYNGFELYEIHDVLITSAQNKDVLVYNGTYWENKSPSYGELYYHNHAVTLDIPTTTAVANVTGMTAGVSKSTTLNASNGTITVSQDGIYAVDINTGFISAGAETYHLYAGVNGAEQDKCSTSRKIATPTDVGSAGLSCLLSLNASDVVTFLVNSLASDTIEFEAVNMNVELIH